ncbi:MAG: sigma-70 family RNA polymerase sigma factor [Bacillota bacterium]|nr:sigma-70 family RNA polymerase sigma factor [Bacillota bacterium]
MTNEELIYLYQQGNKTALDKLLQQNKHIIYMLVNRFYTEGTNSIDKDDLVQEGFMGLMAAANKYDFNNEKKAKFITYAVFWINQKISRFVNTRCTSEEISLNAPTSDDEDNEILDYIEDVYYSFENIEEKLYIQQPHAELDQVMKENLTLLERQILELNYGWKNNKVMALQDVGQIFDMSKERTRQIERRACNKLRRSKWGYIKAREIYLQRKNEIVFN